MGSVTNTLGEREYEGLRLYPLVVDGFRSLRRKPINSMLNLANRYKNIFFKTALCPIAPKVCGDWFGTKFDKAAADQLGRVVTQRRRDFV